MNNLGRLYDTKARSNELREAWLPRDKFEKWIDEPYLKIVAKHCLVRVNIKKSYHLAKIDEMLPNPNCHIIQSLRVCCIAIWANRMRWRLSIQGHCSYRLLRVGSHHEEETVRLPRHERLRRYRRFGRRIKRWPFEKNKNCFCSSWNRKEDWRCRSSRARRAKAGGLAQDLRVHQHVKQDQGLEE